MLLFAELRKTGMGSEARKLVLDKITDVQGGKLGC